MKIAILEGCHHIAESQTEAKNKANWEDVEAASDGEQNMLSRHAEEQSNFCLPVLPYYAPPLKAFVARKLREDEVSEVDWQWATWKNLYNQVCRGLTPKVRDLDLSARWVAWERML
jgi:hypothetical protein